MPHAAERVAARGAGQSAAGEVGAEGGGEGGVCAAGGGEGGARGFCGWFGGEGAVAEGGERAGLVEGGAEGEGIGVEEGGVGAGGGGFARCDFIAEEGLGFGEGESKGGVVNGCWLVGRDWCMGKVEWMVEGWAYLTTLMALGTKRWPLDGAIVAVDLEVEVLWLREAGRWEGGKIWRSGGESASHSHRPDQVRLRRSADPRSGRLYQLDRHLLHLLHLLLYSSVEALFPSKKHGFTYELSHSYLYKFVAIQSFFLH